MIVIISIGISFNSPKTINAETPIKYELALPIVFGSIFEIKDDQWTKVTTIGVSDEVRDILINPTPPHEILVAFKSAGIYKSTNNGDTWRKVFNLGARELTIAPSNEEVIYASVKNSLWGSGDRGETWSNIWSNDIEGGAWTVVVHPLNEDYVYAGINFNSPYHVYATEDRGQNWEPKNLTLPEDEGIHSLAIDPKDTQKIYAGGNTDVSSHPLSTRFYVSPDDGETWSLIENGFPSTKRLTSITFNPCNQNQIFVTRQKHGSGIDSCIRVSNDNGETWNITPLVDDDLIISTDPPCAVFASLHRSMDGGDSWQDISYNFYDFIPEGDRVQFFSWALDQSTNVLWLGTRNHGLFALGNAIPLNNK